jgi:hypothetical protein
MGAIRACDPGGEAADAKMKIDLRYAQHGLTQSPVVRYFDAGDLMVFFAIAMPPVHEGEPFLT